MIFMMMPDDGKDIFKIAQMRKDFYRDNRVFPDDFEFLVG